MSGAQGRRQSRNTTTTTAAADFCHATTVDGQARSFFGRTTPLRSLLPRLLECFPGCPDVSSTKTRRSPALLNYSKRDARKKRLKRTNPTNKKNEKPSMNSFVVAHDATSCAGLAVRRGQFESNGFTTVARCGWPFGSLRVVYGIQQLGDKNKQRRRKGTL